MALIPCPECGWNVSTKATVCPQCGYPLETDPKLHALPDPGNVRQWEVEVGRTLVFEVTGASTGSIYGSEVYTSDSPLATAAVHAGILRPGETGLVRVCIVPVLPSYRSTTRNGIRSLEWETPWYGAYRLERC